jgi:hypothetical protein
VAQRAVTRKSAFDFGAARSASRRGGTAQARVVLRARSFALSHRTG